MGFPELVTENRRLAILRFLASDSDYSLNDSIMQTALKSIGHGVSRDVIRVDFAWLAEQGIVTHDTALGTVHVARLTERGLDVAEGRAVVPGIARPAP